MLAPTATLQAAPIDPMTSWYNDWNEASPQRRRDAPTRLDDFRYRGSTFAQLQDLGTVERTSVPSFGHVMLTPSHGVSPPQVADLTSGFLGAASFREQRERERRGHFDDRQPAGGSTRDDASMPGTSAGLQSPEWSAQASAQPTVNVSGNGRSLVLLSDTLAAAASTLPPMQEQQQQQQRGVCTICLDQFRLGD
jgi:hypothetical protein